MKHQVPSSTCTCSHLRRPPPQATVAFEVVVRYTNEPPSACTVIDIIRTRSTDKNVQRLPWVT